MNTAFDEEHDQVFKILSENESGEVNLEELGKFISELLKNQVKCLQVRLESEKCERSIALQKAMGEVTGEKDLTRMERAQLKKEDKK